MTRVGCLVLVLLLALFTRVLAKGAVLTSEKDSVISSWMKNDSLFPFLHYAISDFYALEEQAGVENRVERYGLGGVVLSNGKLEEIRVWTNKVNAQAIYPPVFIAEIKEIFQLPFEQALKLPTQQSVLCFAEASTVFELGLLHANLMRSSGFQMAKFTGLPIHFNDKESDKILAYFKGLKAGGMLLFMAKGMKTFVDDNLDKMAYKDYDILPVSQWSKENESSRAMKQWRASSDYDGLFSYEEDDLAFLNKEKVKQEHAVFTSTQWSILHKLLTDDYSRGRKAKRRQLRNSSLQFLKQAMLRGRFAESAFSPDSILRRFHELDFVVLNDDEVEIPWADIKGNVVTFSAQEPIFMTSVDRYRLAKHRPISDLLKSIDSLELDLKEGDKLIVDLTGVDHQDMDQLLQVCEALSMRFQLVAFISSQEKLLQSLDCSVKMIWRPVDESNNNLTMIQMLFGARAISGKAPNDLSRGQKSIHRPSLGRLQYKIDSSVFDYPLIKNNHSLYKIDSLIENAIQYKMMPGCQVMVVKKGAVVYDKSFGYFTYDSLQAVNWTHIYDLASLTKTIATLPAVMNAIEEDRFLLSDKIGEVLPRIIGTGKDNLLISDLLIHQSGLRSYIPFWRQAHLKDGKLLYKQKRTRRSYRSLAVNWSDSIQSWIAASTYNSLNNPDGSYRYLYSDLGFMIMKDVIEWSFECSLDDHLMERLYVPLGMDHTAFKPLNSFPINQILPTENDGLMRKRMLQGEVHDKNAALLGGVSGHAGLFSNANDLAKYMQTLMAGGRYGGTQYFNSQTIVDFTTKSAKSYRRALGWDKPDHEVGNVSKYASSEAYGHSGFTGTLVWADPKYDLIYIFLSNRIYPDANNNKLIKSNTRTMIHDFIYESFIDLEKLSNQGQ